MASPLSTARAVVLAVDAPSARRRTVRIGGPELAPILRDHRPAAAVRVDLPGPNGTPRHRVYTLCEVDPVSCSAVLDVIVDSGGPGAQWASNAAAGDRLVVHGPRFGYAVDPDAANLVLIGDDTAQPAIHEICRTLPAGASAQVLHLTSHPDEYGLPPNAMVAEQLCDDVDGVLAALDRLGPFPAGTRFWCAGEVALVHGCRRRIRVDLGVARAHATFAAYWRRGLRLEQTAPLEEAERRLISDAGIELDDVHDHGDIEPLVDLPLGGAARSPL